MKIDNRMTLANQQARKKDGKKKSKLLTLSKNALRQHRYEEDNDNEEPFFFLQRNV